MHIFFYLNLDFLNYRNALKNLIVILKKYIYIFYPQQSEDHITIIIPQTC
jgi:hypothetical protein